MFVIVFSFTSNTLEKDFIQLLAAADGLIIQLETDFHLNAEEWC